ncbi:MAG: plasmid stabilization protein [Clostridia bacterium]|mgnify:CR=1 FL=1|jgi:hypothetical protein|uniref:type II toxin-antitoxin system RelE family toxin n=1 Tax=Petroclostridium xylanilyticum TaxID=1792311 RepID=UPI0018E39C99|nr:hypothetical protein [Petroclostridium xylanilyticum]MBZ4647053.1 plasmid stabilization protein [Clostridia bacterium]
MKFNIRDTQQRKRILSAIYGLPKGDVKKLKGYEYYRLRVGDELFLPRMIKNLLYWL